MIKYFLLVKTTFGFWQLFERLFQHCVGLSDYRLKNRWAHSAKYIPLLVYAQMAALSI